MMMSVSSLYYGVLISISLFIGSVRFFKSASFNLLLFLFLLLAQQSLAVLIFRLDSLVPLVLSMLIYLGFSLSDLKKSGKLPLLSGGARRQNTQYLSLPVLSGIRDRQIVFRYPFANFLVYGGAGSGKTKSIGKWLLEEYMRLGFAGFIYDFKDVDYTRTAYNLARKYNYPHKFYYVNFDEPSYSYRFNPLKMLQDRTQLMQLMEDMLLSMQSKDGKQDEWFAGGLGILRGVAYFMWTEYTEYCTIPHILALIMKASLPELTSFLERDDVSAMMAGAFLKAKGSEKTQASYLSTLCNQLSTIASDENIAWVLTGDDFDFNLIDPNEPKLFAVSNSFSKNAVYSPVISMLMSISARQFTMRNKVPFVYFLDEMTTVRVKNFETLPSVLREYKAAFVLLTQSGAKLESLYGKLDRSSVEANFGNMFLGRTKDVESLKYYPMFFGKTEKERKSRSMGKSGYSSNSSVTISSQKEDVYQGKDFSLLEPGEFIGSATQSNVQDFRVKFRMFEMEEMELDMVSLVRDVQIKANYNQILDDVSRMLAGEV